VFITLSINAVKRDVFFNASSGTASYVKHWIRVQVPLQRRKYRKRKQARLGKRKITGSSEFKVYRTQDLKMTWSGGSLYCSTRKFLLYSISGPVYQPRAASFDVAAKMLLKVEGPSKDCKA
jgi:hypothetical protein